MLLKRLLKVCIALSLEEARTELAIVKEDKKELSRKVDHFDGITTKVSVYALGLESELESERSMVASLKDRLFVTETRLAEALRAGPGLAVRGSGAESSGSNFQG